jgi:flagellum-specific ATP synthase
MRKKRITEPLDLGIRSINGLLTCGKGQRIGIFSGSGVGKSVLLGMIARHTEADVNVIGLIGERGREVREFIERDLKDGIEHSVVVVATSDQPPLIRVRVHSLQLPWQSISGIRAIMCYCLWILLQGSLWPRGR